MAHPVNTFFKKMKKVVKPPSLFILIKSVIKTLKAEGLI